jgi:hypothetical protein
MDEQADELPEEITETLEPLQEELLPIFQGSTLMMTQNLMIF